MVHQKQIMSAQQRDMVGRVVVITGASAGIGLATAKDLAARGADLVLANRSREKSEPVIAELRRLAGHDRVEFVALDLGNLASVRAAGAQLAARPGPIHVLINNAGIGGPRGQTVDGFELAFGTNHLGHFLLTTLLLDKLQKSAPARIIHVSSQAHYQTRGIHWERLQRATRSITALSEYADSKLANVLFSNELARRLEGSGVTSNSLHPGVIASDIWKRLPGPLRVIAKAFMKSTDDGARTTLLLATAPELAAVSGRYYDDCREKTASRAARDASLAADLWRRSEAWTSEKTAAAAA